MSLITKPFTFSVGATIIASEHNSNFDTIYAEFNGCISNANIKANAAIAASKLDLSTVAQDITFSGAITFSDGVTFTGTPTFTSVDINGGNIDGTTIGATTPADGTFLCLTADKLLLNEQSSAPSTSANQGAVYTKETGGQSELFYREESDGDEVQLTNAGVVNFTETAGSHSFSAYESGSGTYAAGKFRADTEDFDVSNAWDTSNDEYTVPATGTYIFGASCHIDQDTNDKGVELQLFVNASQYAVMGGGGTVSNVNAEFGISGVIIAQLTLNDVVYVNIVGNANTPNINKGSTEGRIWGYRIA